MEEGALSKKETVARWCRVTNHQEVFAAVGRGPFVARGYIGDRWKYRAYETLDFNADRRGLCGLSLSIGAHQVIPLPKLGPWEERETVSPN